MAKRKRRRDVSEKPPGSPVQELAEAVKKEMARREKTCSDIIDQVLEKHGCGLFCKMQVSGDGRLFAEPRVVARRDK